MEDFPHSVRKDGNSEKKQYMEFVIGENTLLFEGKLLRN